ncbi:MAG: hypothetical protein ACKOEQ_12405 [Verrucomicrobiota bacterium]
MIYPTILQVAPRGAWASAVVAVAAVLWAMAVARAADASSAWALAPAAAPVVAASVEVEADWLAVPVRFSCEGGSGLKSSGASAWDEARAAADAAGRLPSQEGMWVVRDPERLAAELPLRSGNVSLFGGDGGATVLVMVPFKDSTEAPASAAGRAAQWVATWRPPNRGKAEVGSPTVAVLDPEKHRTSVVRAVAAKMADDKLALVGPVGAATRVSGLEGVVRARSLGGRKVALFIRYTVEVSSGGQ